MSGVLSAAHAHNRYLSFVHRAMCSVGSGMSRDTGHSLERQREDVNHVRSTCGKSTGKELIKRLLSLPLSTIFQEEQHVRLYSSDLSVQPRPVYRQSLVREISANT